MKLRNILILLAILLALGGYFYFSNLPKPAPEKEKRFEVWSIDEEVLQRIEIRLPPENKRQTFIKETIINTHNETDVSWHFDDAQRSSVNMTRWGGMTLLLNGPGAERVIATNATQEKLAAFGLTQPRMEITLTLADGQALNITVGDKTPDGHAFYVQVPGSNNVATVDISWYQVVERLVKEPPYAGP